MFNLKTIKKRKRKFANTLQAYSFIAPSAIILLIIMLIPIIMVVYYSFFDNMVVENTPFVGLKNYLLFLSDPNITKMLRFTVIFTIGSVSLHLFIGLGLAVKLNHKINKIVLGIFRAIFVLPWIFTAAVVAVTWQLILMPQGILNSVISSIIGDRLLIDWLGTPIMAMITLVIVSAWRGYPFCMTSFLAGLQGIPDVLYEAGKIDGANKKNMFLHITLPQLKPIILSVVLLDTIWTLNLFPLIWLLTGGGPQSATDTIATFTYRYAFVNYQFGVASAAATVGLIVTLVFTMFYISKQKQVN